MKQCPKCETMHDGEDPPLCPECRREANFVEAILDLRGDVVEDEEVEQLISAIDWLQGFSNLDDAARAFEARYHTRLVRPEFPSSKGDTRR